MNKTFYKRKKGSFVEIIRSMIQLRILYYVESVSIKQKSDEVYEAVFKLTNRH
jgi:hypothetical protein